MYSAIRHKSLAESNEETITSPPMIGMTVWPSGLRRWLQAPVRKGVGSNPTAVTFLQSASSNLFSAAKLRALAGHVRLCRRVGLGEARQRQACGDQHCAQGIPHILWEL